MTAMYVPPLVRAWEKTRAVLFRPFSAETWIVIGFSAFLARLADGGLVAGSAPKWRVSLDDGSLLDLGQGLLTLLFVLPLFALAIAIGVVLLWISSRGQLVFLDDALAGRGAIAEPWKRNGQLGDSLFLWRLALYGLTVAAIMAGLWPLAVYSRLEDLRGGIAAIGVVGAALSLAFVGVIALTATFIALLLGSFVVPLMYRYRTTAGDAWRRFLPLLRRHPLSFVLYALFVMGLWITIFTAIIVVGVATCCIPFIPLSIPYVNTVLLLPFLMLLRLFAVEFLAQFGEEFTVVAGRPAEVGP